ncbi:MAG: acyl-CoA dehydrogenase family protein [Bacillota bacterium]
MVIAFTEDQIAIQEGVREFAHSRVLPRAAEIDRTDIFPRDLWQEMAAHGLFGVPFPEEYGGLGAGYVAYVLAVEELVRASMSVGVLVSVQGLAQEAILRFGTEEQKQRYLKPLVQGEKIGCFAFTEAGTGSDPKALMTRWVRDGQQYVLAGTKTFITHATVADAGVIFAKGADGKVSAFIVEAGSPGWQPGRQEDKLGLHGTGTAELVLDDVRVPAHNLLGREGDGFRILLQTISVGKLAVAAQGVGISQAALDASVRYARERTAYGKPIAQFQTTQWLIAEMAARLEAARWLTYRTAQLLEDGTDISRAAAQCKLFSSRAAVQTSSDAMQIHGAYSYSKDYVVERLYRDAKITEIYEGTSEIQRVIIANALLRE